MNEDREDRLEALLSSCSKVTARMVESVHRTAQIAGCATPEVQELFDRWLDVLADDIARTFENGGEANIEQEAARIGISEGSYLALLLALHRRGALRIATVSARRENEANREICSCLREA